MQTPRIRRVQRAAWLAVIASLASVVAVALYATEAAVILALIVPLVAAAGLDAYLECEGEGQQDRPRSTPSFRERVLSSSFTNGLHVRDSVPPGAA